MTGEHKHHWMITEAFGPTSQGTCVFCNLTREFNNVPADLSWRDPAWVKRGA